MTVFGPQHPNLSGKSVIRQCLTVDYHWRPPVRAIMLHEPRFIRRDLVQSLDILKNPQVRRVLGHESPHDYSDYSVTTPFWFAVVALPFTPKSCRFPWDILRSGSGLMAATLGESKATSGTMWGDRCPPTVVCFKGLLDVHRGTPVK